MLRVGINEILSCAQLEITIIKARCDGTAYQGEGASHIHRSTEPASGSNHRLKYLTALIIITQNYPREIPLSHLQSTPVTHTAD